MKVNTNQHNLVKTLTHFTIIYNSLTHKCSVLSSVLWEIKLQLMVMLKGEGGWIGVASAVT